MGQEIKIKIINEFINDNNLKSRGEIKYVKYKINYNDYKLMTIEAMQ